MCGRYIIKGSWREFVDALRIIRTDDRGLNFPARYNVAPTQDVPFVARESEEIHVKQGRWWLVPHWAKEIPKYAMFNARSETAREKASFRDAFKSKRCLVPADGYYEWTKSADGGKDPHCISLPDFEPFVFAGLWSHNTNLDVTSCTILTAATPPNIAISDVHNRVPIILNKDNYVAWLDPNVDVESASALLDNHRASELTAYRVSRDVNKNSASGSELIEPV